MSVQTQEEMMQAWQVVARPGPFHEPLKTMEGRWDTKVKMRFSPEQPWMEGAGEMIMRLVLDGRWLAMEYTGSAGGCPFAGLGYMGYDNVLQKYVGLWMDTASTTVMVNYGNADANLKVFTQFGEIFQPGVPTPLKYKTVTTLVSRDRMTYQMFWPAPGGAGEWCGLDIAYTRK